MQTADPAYRDTVLPPGIRARVSVEAVSSGWGKIIGDTGRSVGAERYGTSAEYQTLYRQFGITAAAGCRRTRQHPRRPERLPARMRPVTFAPAGGTAGRPA